MIKMKYYKSIKDHKQHTLQEKSRELELALKQLYEKQTKEEDALYTKLESKQATLLKMRDQEIDEINNRMNVVLSDLDLKHTKEYNKLLTKL